MTDSTDPGGPIDGAAPKRIARRGAAHPLVEQWQFDPDALSPRGLTLRLDSAQYPGAVDTVRLDVRWYEGGDFTVHYVESRRESSWQCRWDRHHKPAAPNAHFHPPPDAATTVEASDLDDSHPLGLVFAVLEYVEERLRAVHDG